MLHAYSLYSLKSFGMMLILIDYIAYLSLFILLVAYLSFAYLSLSVDMDDLYTLHDYLSSM